MKKSLRFRRLVKVNRSRYPIGSDVDSVNQSESVQSEDPIDLTVVYGDYDDDSEGTHLYEHEPIRMFESLQSSCKSTCLDCKVIYENRPSACPIYLRDFDNIDYESFKYFLIRINSKLPLYQPSLLERILSFTRFKSYWVVKIPSGA